MDVKIKWDTSIVMLTEQKQGESENNETYSIR